MIFSTSRSLLAASALAACACLASTGPADAQGIDPGPTARQVFDFLNAYRSQSGQPLLNDRDELMTSAASFASYIAGSGNFSHTADGRGFDDRARAADYNCPRGENLGQIMFWQAQDTEALAQEFMKQWRDSPGHDENMLMSDAVDVGIGVAEGTDRYYAVMVLGGAGC